MEKFELRQWSVWGLQAAKDISLIKNNNMFGLVSDDEILPPIYSSITPINKTDSIVWFKVALKDKYGIIQCDLKESKFILDIEYDSIEWVNFEKDYYNHFFLVKKNGLKGVYNKHGDLCVPCLYDEIKFDEHHFFYLERNQQVEAYSINEKEYISLKYDKIEVTPDGAKVYLGNHVGAFREGKEVCPPIYDDVEFEYGNDIIIKVGKLLGVITESGSIIEPKFENLTYLTSGYYGFLHNNKWGVVSTNCIIPPKYDYIYDGRYSCNIYGRIGREMYNISKKEKFIETFLLDQSCGYEKTDSPILKFDSSDIDLLAF